MPTPSTTTDIELPVEPDVLPDITPPDVTPDVTPRPGTPRPGTPEPGRPGRRPAWWRRALARTLRGAAGAVRPNDQR